MRWVGGVPQEEGGGGVGPGAAAQGHGASGDDQAEKVRALGVEAKWTSRAVAKAAEIEPTHRHIDDGLQLLLDSTCGVCVQCIGAMLVWPGAAGRRIGCGVSRRRASIAMRLSARPTRGAGQPHITAQIAVRLPARIEHRLQLPVLDWQHHVCMQAGPDTKGLPRQGGRQGVSIGHEGPQRRHAVQSRPAGSCVSREHSRRAASHCTV